MTAKAYEQKDTKSTQEVFTHLKRLFIWIWIGIFSLNIIGGWLLIHSQLALGMSSLIREDRFSRSLPEWPVNPFGTHNWPSPKHSAVFHSKIPFVQSTYAISWDSEGNKYYMDVIHFDLPIALYAVGSAKVVDRNGAIIPRLTSSSKTELILNPSGIILSPLIQTTVIWVLFGVIPVSMRKLAERERKRNWEKYLLCQKCGYDILDLPICPECGTATHKEGNRNPKSPQLADESSR